MPVQRLHACLSVRFYRCLLTRSVYDKLPTSSRDRHRRVQVQLTQSKLAYTPLFRAFLSARIRLITSFRCSFPRLNCLCEVIEWHLSDGYFFSCVFSEKRATEGSGLVSHYEQKRKISDSETMSDKKADTVYGKCVIPCETECFSFG